MSKRSSVRVWVCRTQNPVPRHAYRGIDLLLTHGKTARGATVAGLDAGNLTPTQSRRCSISWQPGLLSL